MKDITVFFTDRSGTRHLLKAPTDMNMNLMELARSFELEPEGTIGICGGIALCASCQCYIESNHRLSALTDDEEAMLSEALYVKENSRLSCQIPLTEDLDGLHVTLAPES